MSPIFRQVLFIVAHPALAQSRANRAIVNEVKKLSFVTIHDLYENYPYFHIPAGKEQELLLKHDLVFFQHPFYWYSVPPLLKLWQDEVLQSGWAYGPGGNNLKGKEALVSITTGGDNQAYSPEGRNRFTIETLLSPWNQTIHLCQMQWQEPMILHRAIKATPQELANHAMKVSEKIKAWAQAPSQNGVNRD